MEALIDRHWRSSWLVARGITGDPTEAEDVVQEAMISALGSLARFDPERGSFAAWIHRITANRALNRRRDRRTTVDVSAVDGARLDGHGANAEFLSAIDCLSRDHRAVVVLRYGLDYSPREIAETLDVRLGTVHSRLARALEILRDTTRRTPHG